MYTACARRRTRSRVRRNITKLQHWLATTLPHWLATAPARHKIARPDRWPAGQPEPALARSSDGISDMISLPGSGLVGVGI